jgi:hypothetical protein
VLRMLVGAQLRKLRETAGISREAAGYEIRASGSKISRLELGRVGFKERDVSDLLTLYAVSDPADRRLLLDLARKANAPGWWHRYSDLLPGWFQPYLGLESAAATIRAYEAQYVPGLLQTRDYARSVVMISHGTGTPSGPKVPATGSGSPLPAVGSRLRLSAPGCSDPGCSAARLRAARLRAARLPAARLPDAGWRLPDPVAQAAGPQPGHERRHRRRRIDQRRAGGIPRVPHRDHAAARHLGHLDAVAARAAAPRLAPPHPAQLTRRHAIDQPIHRYAPPVDRASGR